MTSARIAIAASLLLFTSPPARAQDTAGGQTTRPTATKGGTAPGRPSVRPKRPGLFDIIRTLAPPLIDAATSRPPPPPRDPVPDPVAAADPVQPAITAPAVAQPAVLVAAPAPPIVAVPKPAPTPPPAATTTPRPIPLEPVQIPATPAAAPPLVESPSPIAPPPSPAAVRQRPPPLAAAESPPAATVVPRLGRTTLTSSAVLALLAAIAAAAGLLHLRRSRLIAATRAALSLSPSLDPLDGDCPTGGLVLTGPRLAIQARLLPAGHD